MNTPIVDDSSRSLAPALLDAIRLAYGRGQYIAALEADLATYREIATQGIHSLHEVTKDRDRYKEKYFALLDERRAARDVLQKRAA